MKTRLETLLELLVPSLLCVLSVNAVGETPKESDRESEWSEVSTIVEQFQGVFEEPPLTANLEADRTTAEAPILGNGQ